MFQEISCLRFYFNIFVLGNLLCSYRYLKISFLDLMRDLIKHISKNQNIKKEYPLFVTLNPPEPPASELTFGYFEYDHPQFDRAAFNAQSDLASIQGNRHTWFCGAWAGFGFHEDGLQSAQTIVTDIESRDYAKTITNVS